MTASASDQALLAAALPRARTRVTRAGRIEYRERGPTGAPAVVMLHGLGSNAAGYRAALHALSDQSRVIAWNAPGFGGSAAAPEQAGIGDYADAVAALLDALDIERAHLVGSSWGSLVAVACAGQHPARVDRLVLAAPTRGYGWLPEEQRARQLAQRLAAAHCAPADPGARAARFLSPAADAAAARRFLSLAAGLTPAGYAAATRSLYACDGLELAAQVRAPVLLLAGEDDAVCPHAQHAEPMREALRDARLHRIPQCGHIPKLEAPARFTDELRAFFAHDTH